MFLDRLKPLSVERAAKLMSVDSSVLVKAMERYRRSGGRFGLAFVVLPGQSRRRIRLSAIDDWLSRLEEESRYE